MRRVRSIGDRRAALGVAAGMASSLAVAGLPACSSPERTVPATVRVLGTVDLAAPASIPADATISISLVRGDQVLDAVEIRPTPSGPPWSFELLYDGDQAGGSASITIAVRGTDGSDVRVAVAPRPIPLDGTPRVVNLEVDAGGGRDGS